MLTKNHISLEAIGDVEDFVSDIKEFLRNDRIGINIDCEKNCDGCLVVDRHPFNSYNSCVAYPKENMDRFTYDIGHVGPNFSVGSGIIDKYNYHVIGNGSSRLFYFIEVNLSNFSEEDIKRELW